MCTKLKWENGNVTLIISLAVSISSLKMGWSFPTTKAFLDIITVTGGVKIKHKPRIPFLETGRRRHFTLKITQHLYDIVDYIL